MPSTSRHDRLVSDVVPKILALRSAGNSPITVYINSDGGNTAALDAIVAALKTNDPDGKRARIITVAIGTAGSAAATLLALGDYAIAYPNSLVHFHGVRIQDQNPITMEKASRFATWLQETNNQTAMRLVESVVYRLAFHYAIKKSDFPEIRKAEPTITDVECFACAIMTELSPVGVRIVQRARQRWAAIKKMSDYVGAKMQKKDPPDMVTYDAAVLRLIISYELKENRNRDWQLDTSGIAKIVEDYTILRDYHLGAWTGFLIDLANNFSEAFLTEKEMDELVTVSKGPEDKYEEWIKATLGPRIKPFLYFTLSLCRGLQESENPLAVEDAYWLGAVDEILESDLPCMRDLMENRPKPDQPTLPAATSPEPHS